MIKISKVKNMLDKIRYNMNKMLNSRIAHSGPGRIRTGGLRRVRAMS